MSNSPKDTTATTPGAANPTGSPPADSGSPTRQPGPAPGSATGGASPTTRPLRIHADRASGTLAIVWADGHGTTYDAETLRRLCPCAYCRGEAGLPGWLDSNPTFSPSQTQLVDVALVGQYALKPTWADGHDTGYYTFELLRQACPCETCTSRSTERP